MKNRAKMKFNFDEPVDRHNTNCVKYDGMKSAIGATDAIPMWVADMDFKSPPFIAEALQKRLDHGVFGYTIRPDGFFESIVNWMQKRHQWEIQKEWISFSPGVVAGFTLAIEEFTQPGDKIIIQPPVYFPFFHSINDTGRKLVTNPLKFENGRYGFDIEDMKRKIDADTRMLLLCNPHNPGGSVWSKEELLEISRVCLENNILVVSDEIHADVVYPPAKHTPYASISDEAAMNSFTVMSHSKTFNVAGLTTSFVISANKELLTKYNRGLYIPHLHMGNLFGTEALMAAYNHGADWVDDLVIYLKENINLVASFMEQHMPKMKVIIPQSTFLIWIDCCELGLEKNELISFFSKQSKVAVNDGGTFGVEGKGFIRMNIGCPKSTVQKALNQILDAYKANNF